MGSHLEGSAVAEQSIGQTARLLLDAVSYLLLLSREEGRRNERQLIVRAFVAHVRTYLLDAACSLFFHHVSSLAPKDTLLPLLNGLQPQEQHNIDSLLSKMLYQKASTQGKNFFSLIVPEKSMILNREKRTKDLSYLVCPFVS